MNKACSAVVASMVGLSVLFVGSESRAYSILSIPRGAAVTNLANNCSDYITDAMSGIYAGSGSTSRGVSLPGRGWMVSPFRKMAPRTEGS